MKRILASVGALAVFALLSTPTVFANSQSALVQSNAVKVTGGYQQTYQTQQYQQTGTTTRQVQVQTGGGYYASQTVQSGSHQECTTTEVATNHATYYPGHWVNGWSNGVGSTCTTGWNGGGCGYWSAGWYAAPYWDTYDPVTTCTTVPDYTTQTYWVPPTYGYQTQTVPVYGYVTVNAQRWVPVVVQ